MKTTVNLESKDVREIIAKFLCVRADQVIPQRYSYAVTGMNADEIARRIYGPTVREAVDGAEGDTA